MSGFIPSLETPREEREFFKAFSKIFVSVNDKTDMLKPIDPYRYSPYHVSNDADY